MISPRSRRRDRDLAETSPIFSRARAQTARAVFALRAERPWALTGTPVQNDPAELYSLLHFLRVPVASSYGKWTKELARPDRLRALQGLIRPLMLRRTKGTKDADGARDCAEIAPVRPRGRRRLTSKPRVTVWQMSHATHTCVDPSAMDVGHPSRRCTCISQANRSSLCRNSACEHSRYRSRSRRRTSTKRCTRARGRSSRRELEIRARLRVAVESEIIGDRREIRRDCPGRYAAEGKVLANYASVLELLLRLRQARISRA